MSQHSAQELFNKNNKNKNHHNADNIHLMKELIHQNATKIQSKWRKIVTGNERKRIRDHLRETEEQPKYVKLFDKLGFTFGVVNILICQYFLLNIPESFSIWYSFIIPIIIASRFYHFRSLNWHYFLIDFCYFVNVCTLINLFFFPTSGSFFKVCFIHATGTLPLAIPIWRNSLVFHDYDKIVSVYIHILPCMLYYTLRWYNSNSSNDNSNNNGNIDNVLDERFAGCGNENSLSCVLTWQDYGYAIILYIFWQVIYIYKTEILDLEKFNKNPDLLTSLRWMSKDTKNPLARKVLSFLKKLGIFAKNEDYDSTSMKTKLVFVASQFVITLISLLPSYLIFNSSRAHLIYIGIIFFSAMFNGASFYIEVFSVRYHLSLEKLEKMHKIAFEANTVMKQIAELRETERQGQFNGVGTKKNADLVKTSENQDKAEERPKSSEGEDNIGKITTDLQETTAEALKHIKKHTKKLMLTRIDHLPNADDHDEEEDEEEDGYEGEEDNSDYNHSFTDKNLEKYLLNIEDDVDGSLTNQVKEIFTNAPTTPHEQHATEKIIEQKDTVAHE